MIKQESYWVLEAESRVLFLGCLVWHGQASSLLWTSMSPPEKWEFEPEDTWGTVQPDSQSSPRLCPCLLLFLRQSGRPSLFHCFFVLLVMAGSIISIPPEPRGLQADNWNLESRTRRLSRGDVNRHIFTSSEWATILPKRQEPGEPKKSIWTYLDFWPQNPYFIFA